MKVADQVMAFRESLGMKSLGSEDGVSLRPLNRTDEPRWIDTEESTGATSGVLHLGPYNGAEAAEEDKEGHRLRWRSQN